MVEPLWTVPVGQWSLADLIAVVALFLVLSTVIDMLLVGWMRRK